MKEQQATEQQASREAHLNTNGRKGNSSSVRSDTQGVAGKTAGSRTYAQFLVRGDSRRFAEVLTVDIYGTIRLGDPYPSPRIRVRASILYGIPYREAASANAKIVRFVRYDYERDVRLRNDFFGNP